MQGVLTEAQLRAEVQRLASFESSTMKLLPKVTERVVELEEALRASRQETQAVHDQLLAQGIAFAAERKELQDELELMHNEVDFEDAVAEPPGEPTPADTSPRAMQAHQTIALMQLRQEALQASLVAAEEASASTAAKQTEDVEYARNMLAKAQKVTLASEEKARLAVQAAQEIREQRDIERKEAERKLQQKVAARFRHLREGQAFEVWAGRVRWRRRTKVIATRAVSRIVQSRVSLLFCAWSDLMAKNMAGERAKSALEAQAAALSLEKDAQLVLLKQQKNDELAQLARQRSLEKEKQTLEAEQVLARLKREADAEKQLLVEEHEQEVVRLVQEREKAFSTAPVMMQAHQTVALMQLRQQELTTSLAAAEEASAAMAAKQKGDTESAKRSLQNKVVQRLRNVCVGHALGAWLQWVCWRRGVERIMARAAVRLKDRRLSTVFWAWSEHAAESVELRAKEQLTKAARDMSCEVVRLVRDNDFKFGEVMREKEAAWRKVAQEREQDKLNWDEEMRNAMREKDLEIVRNQEELRNVLQDKAGIVEMLQLKTQQIVALTSEKSNVEKAQSKLQAQLLQEQEQRAAVQVALDEQISEVAETRRKTTQLVQEKGEQLQNLVLEQAQDKVKWRQEKEQQLLDQHTEFQEALDTMAQEKEQTEQKAKLAVAQAHMAAQQVRDVWSQTCDAIAAERSKQLVAGRSAAIVLQDLASKTAKASEALGLARNELMAMKADWKQASSAIRLERNRLEQREMELLEQRNALGVVVAEARRVQADWSRTHNSIRVQRASVQQRCEVATTALEEVQTEWSRARSAMRVQRARLQEQCAVATTAAKRLQTEWNRARIEMHADREQLLQEKEAALLHQRTEFEVALGTITQEKEQQVSASQIRHENETRLMSQEHQEQRDRLYDALGLLTEQTSHRIVSAMALARGKKHLTQCFIVWQAWAEREVLVERRLRTVVLRLQVVHAASAFESWLEHTLDKRDITKLTLQIVDCAACIGEKLTQQAAEFHEVLSAVTLEKDEESRAAAQHRLRLVQERDEEMVVQRARWSEALGELATIGTDRVVKATDGARGHRGTAKCFIAWEAWTAQGRTRKILQCKVILRVRKLHLAGTLGGWAGWSCCRRRARALISRFAVRLAHRLLSAIFWAWAYHAANMKAADDAKDALESQASDFRGSLGLIKLERDEDRAQMAQEMKEQYGRIVLATTRARLRQKSMNFFVTWRVRSAKHKATQQLHRKIVLRLRNFRASHAFGAWMRWVRWHRRALEITGRSLARLRHSQISAVVCLWRSETSRSEAEKLAKAVLGKQAADFRGAIGLAELEKEEDMAMLTEAKEQELLEQHTAFQKVLSTVAHEKEQAALKARAVADELSTLGHEVEHKLSAQRTQLTEEKQRELLEQQGVMHDATRRMLQLKVMSRMTNLRVAHAFGGWAGWRIWRRRAKAVMATSVARLKYRQTFPVFRAWCDCLRDLQSAAMVAAADEALAAANAATASFQEVASRNIDQLSHQLTSEKMQHAVAKAQVAAVSAEASAVKTSATMVHINAADLDIQKREHAQVVAGLEARICVLLRENATKMLGRGDQQQPPSEAELLVQMAALRRENEALKDRNAYITRRPELTLATTSKQSKNRNPRTPSEPIRKSTLPTTTTASPVAHSHTAQVQLPEAVPPPQRKSDE